MADHNYWLASAEPTAFPELTGTIEADVAIVGGGIVGVTTARLLKSAGVSVALVEARRIGRQATGRSTAKVTSQHGLRYKMLADKFGEDSARLYADAQEAGVRRIVELAAEFGVDADVEPMPAYVFTQDAAYVRKIEDEAVVAQRLGLPATVVRETELPFPVLMAVRWDNQAQFHPIRYLAGLAATIPGEGSQVFEQSRVTSWDSKSVTTDKGSVRAGHVVMATHLPLGKIGMYFSRAFPKAEPAIAAPIEAPLRGMYISAEEPTRSIRTHRRNGQTSAIAVGQHFKPGHTEMEQQGIASLENWLTENFRTGPVANRWINEDFTSMDGVGFVGWSSGVSERYLVATGFDAWGISNGAAAAMMITDLVLGRDNPWLTLFDAKRFKPLQGGKEFLAENLHAARHMASGFLSRKPDSYDELAPGEAGVLKIGGDSVAAFKDEAGAVHAVSAACTHLGCEVAWNATDRTWDCPCHGSRFALDGEVLHGPATAPLARCSPHLEGD